MSNVSREGVVPTACPVCETNLDAASCPKDAKARPQPGDLSVCIRCATILCFVGARGGVTVRKATNLELATLGDDEREALEKTRRAVLRLRAEEMR